MQLYKTLDDYFLNKKNNIFVDAQMPRYGLGNMLLVWARAILFAELNRLPVLSPNWSEIRIGPWLRGERVKRYYGNLFSNQGYYPRFKYFLQKSLYQENIIYNPTLRNPIDLPLLGDKYNRIIFNQMPPWNDYFQDLKEHQPLIKDSLIKIIRPSLLDKINRQSHPCIGIHIRMGDFREPKAGDDYAINRITRTPIQWFAKVLQSVRDIAGCNLPATVFSDGHIHELEEVLKLPNVSLSTNQCALTDLITLSRSQLIIASSHSSFSAWAAYLGECPTIWYLERSHLYKYIYLESIRNKIFEGGYDPVIGKTPEVLIKNINQIKNNNY